MNDVAAVLIGNRPIPVRVTGIRPGEKEHEILVSEEEMSRTRESGDYYVIAPMLPELRRDDPNVPTLTREYSSADDVMSRDELDALLRRHKLTVEDGVVFEEDLLA